MLAKCHISVVTVPVGEELTVSLVTNSRRGVLLGEAVNGIAGVLGCLAAFGAIQYVNISIMGPTFN